MKRLSALTLILMLLLAACGGDAASTPPAAAASSAPASSDSVSSPPATGDGDQEKELVTRSEDDLINSDPAHNASSQDLNVQTNVLDALIRIDPITREYVPSLAESWEASDDNLVYTFFLREGVQWHGGYGEFTADDVVFSFTRIKDPDTGSRFLSDFAPVESVEAVDDYTVRITLNRPYPEFFDAVLTYTPGFIVHEAAVEELGESYAQNPIGTGPYMFEDYTPGVEFVLVRNPDYWGPEPAIDRVVFKIIPDEQVALLALEQGELDIAYFLQPATQLEVRDLDGVEVVDRPSPGVHFFHFNLTRPPLDDVRVRQALAWAINKQGIVDNVYLGQGQVAHSMIPPGVFGHVNEEVYGYDLDRARELLAEAGYPDGFPGQTFEFVTYDGRANPDILQAIQADWALIGFQTEAQVVDLATLNELRRAQDHDVLMLDTLRVAPSLFLVPYLHGRSIPFPNTSGYTGIDTLLDEAQTETDDDARAALYEEIQSQIQADLPIISLLYRLEVLAMQPSVEGAVPYLNLLNLAQMDIQE